jgi:hypothetical protein
LSIGLSVSWDDFVLSVSLGCLKAGIRLRAERGVAPAKRGYGYMPHLGAALTQPRTR